MTTWLTETVRRANERPFNDVDASRMLVYFQGLPARMKLGEELERAEGGLARRLFEEAAKRYPDEPLITRPLCSDLVEGLRHLYFSVLADEPRLLRDRWTDHARRLLPAVGVDPRRLRGVYGVLRELLEARLSGAAWDLLRTAFDDMVDTLAAAPGDDGADEGEGRS